MLTKRKCCCEGPAEGQFPYGHVMLAPQPWLPGTAHVSCLQVLKGSLGSAVQMVLFWVPLCDLGTPWDLQLRGAGYSTAMRTEGKEPPERQAEMWQGLQSRLILVGVLSVPHETDTEAESEAWPLLMKYIIGQWLMCLFSTDVTIYVTQLLVNIFHAWGPLLPNWPLCPQMLLISLPCCDALVLQWDHTPTGVLHGWMILCCLWLCLCMLGACGCKHIIYILRE